MTRRPRATRRAHRRGMTFLEVVLAVVLLGLLASSVAMLSGAQERAQRRHKDTLATHELANAIILQYIHDPNTVPPDTEPLAYNDQEYRFDFRESRANVTLNAAAFEDDRAARRERNVDRVRQVTVTVWPSEEYGGSFRFDENLPHATLTRLVDPLSFSNPDSFQQRIESEEGLSGIMTELFTLDSGAPVDDEGDEQ